AQTGSEYRGGQRLSRCAREATSNFEVAQPTVERHRSPMMPALTACCRTAPCAHVAVGTAKVPTTQETSPETGSLPGVAIKDKSPPLQAASTPQTSLAC